MDKINITHDSNSCENMLDKISFYVEDELSDCDKNLLEGHLSTCYECTKALKEFNDIKIVLNNIKPLDLPTELNMKIKESLNVIKPTMKANRFNYKRWSAVAAVFVLGFISIQMYNGFDDLINPNEALKSKGVSEIASMSDQTVMKYSGPELKYLEVMNEKLAGYTYEIVSEDIEKSELVINIISDKDGNIINRNLIITYDQNNIYVKDNWLKLKL